MEITAITAIILSIISILSVGTLTYYVFKHRPNDDTVKKISERQDEIDNIINNYELKSKKR